MKMKNLIYLLMAMPLLFTSCSKDDEMASEETVQVSFRAELPRTVGTRATSDLTVNKVECAVFEKGEEIQTLRETVKIKEGEEIKFSPRLIKGRTYDIVFWAYYEDCYDVDDMTYIIRNTDSDKPEGKFDAFTATKEVKVINSQTEETITLTRPLAQLNVGVTSEDWTTVTTNFSMTPTTMTIEIDGKEAFNALTGMATGSDETITYNLSCSGSDLVVNGTTYKSIASCYVLPEAQKENFAVTYQIFDQNQAPFRSDEVTISEVPFETNHKTNIVGGLLTGTVICAISIEDGFKDAEYNEPIQ